VSSFETNEISFTTNLAGRRSKQLVGNVRALSRHTEMFIYAAQKTTLHRRQHYTEDNTTQSIALFRRERYTEDSTTLVIALYKTTLHRRKHTT
jgi:hypothetical protein